MVCGLRQLICPVDNNHREYRQLELAHITPELAGNKVRIRGYLGQTRQLKGVSFVNIHREQCKIQLVLSDKEGRDAYDLLSSGSINPYSAVEVCGTVKARRPPKQSKGTSAEATATVSDQVEISVSNIKVLSDFPSDILTGEVAKYGPEQRHLQLRFDAELAGRIRFRSKMFHLMSTYLDNNSFMQVDTPLLFKSTPEGAREFLVPTRTLGFAYALPQSPQQYKQTLMASGVDKYYQFAHCFRDEDLRADRQPEFTQLDLEMAYARGEDVMQVVEDLVRSSCSSAGVEHQQTLHDKFPRMTYHEAMSQHGVDKPDLRIKDLISDVTYMIPEQLKGMMTSLESPIIEAFKLNLGTDPNGVREFIAEEMDGAGMRPFNTNPDGPPGVAIYDPSKPLNGLQMFGHEGAKAIEEHFMKQAARANGGSLPEGFEPFQEGDFIILQARPNTPRFYGGSTALGRLRTLFWKSAVAKDLIEVEPGFKPLWVHDFPLFTPNNDVDPGQGGTSGFSATHHPFTSPKSAADVDLLLTSPLDVIADHYDLVMNGVELGGGSSRIHNAEMQEWIMREILKMPEERIEDFRHLFEALRAGCPPHAGLAIGFDRLVAVMLGRESIRDVIAFPKDNKGRDMLIRSPTMMTESQQATYHLKVLQEGDGVAQKGAKSNEEEQREVASEPGREL